MLGHGGVESSTGSTLEAHPKCQHRHKQYAKGLYVKGLKAAAQARTTPYPAPSLCHAAGRVVIELFDDIAPVAVSHFRNRCSEGASDTFKGTVIYKVLREQAIFGGKSNRWVGGRGCPVWCLVKGHPCLQCGMSAELPGGLALGAHLLLRLF